MKMFIVKTEIIMKIIKINVQISKNEKGNTLSRVELIAVASNS